MMVRFLTLFLALAALFPLRAEEAVRAQLLSEKCGVQPGVPAWFMVRLHMDEGWHTYWSNPGEVGRATEIEWEVPEGFCVSATQWPFPSQFVSSGIVGFGYSEEAHFLVCITPPVDLEMGKKVEIAARASWLACSDQCEPGEEHVSIMLPVCEAPAACDAEIVALFEAARQRVPRRLAAGAVNFHKGALNIGWDDHDATLIGVPSDAYFFPYSETPVDIGSQQCLTMAGEDDFSYRLSVPLSRERGNPPANVKGVLVVSGAEQGQPVAYEVDLAVNAEDAQEASLALPWILIFAFLGGAILNLMPCVFPVISLKALKFVKLAGQDRMKTFAYSGMFSLGVVVSFWALVGVLLLLRASGENVGWGFQLQNPYFVLGLLFVLFLIGLNLFGLFEWGSGVTGAASKAESATSGPASFFFSGVLATAIATPCSGPFMATALGAAMLLPTPQIFLTFTLMALGMSLPYLLLGAFPALVAYLPRPGPWMVRFKQFLGFLMMASVLWLFYVLAKRLDATSLVEVGGALLITALGAWIFGNWGTPLFRPLVRHGVQGVSLGLLALSFWMAVQATAIKAHWEPYSQQRLQELRASGTPVFVDFTARWCLTCLANRPVLHSKKVAEKMRALGVVPMEADWTMADPEITRALRSLGRVSVPAYVLYGSNSDQEPTLLPQVLTQETLVHYLDQVE